MLIERLDHEEAAVREQVFGYLAPQEAHGLFILGNLNTRFPGTHLYAASADGRWRGLAGYYEGPRSVIPVAGCPEAARALARHVLAAHPTPQWLLGGTVSAGPALEVFLEQGFSVRNNPHHVFMETALPESLAPDCGPHAERVRFIRPGDGEPVARLLRLLRDPGNTAPLTAEEVAGAEANALRVVLEADGQIVATAATNGIGLRAFQILGVVTDPAFRQRGYARAVCLALMRHMHGQGARHCVLFTDAANVAAQRCYAGIGFRITGDFIVARLAAPVAVATAPRG